MTQKLTVVAHPLLRHKLDLMRDKSTPTSAFTALLGEIALILGVEATRDLPLESYALETPLCAMQGAKLAGRKLALVSVLRAGNGLLDGLRALIPAARVGFIGLARDEETLQPVQYYCKLPDHLAERAVLVVDPMLATGNSAVAAIDLLKAKGARDIRLICLVAAPEGVARMAEAHPDVAVYAGALDSHLNAHGYIVPGLGDAGDRMFGTK